MRFFFRDFRILVRLAPQPPTARYTEYSDQTPAPSTSIVVNLDAGGAGRVDRKGQARVLDREKRNVLGEVAGAFVYSGAKGKGERKHGLEQEMYILKQ